MTIQNNREELLRLSAEIISAHVSNNSVAASDLPQLIEKVYGSLARVSAPQVLPEETQNPAVSIRASIKPDYLVCLEDGKKLTMLKRYLASTYDMTPEEYRAKWNLPADYPMVAPNYAARRSELAKKIGLGGRRTAKAKAPAEAAEASQSSRRRKLTIAVPNA